MRLCIAHSLGATYDAVEGILGRSAATSARSGPEGHEALPNTPLDARWASSAPDASAARSPAALRAAGLAVEGPAGRGEAPSGCGALLLCVPDAEIAAAAATVAGAAPYVGHVSGATPLAALAPAARAGAKTFGLHPLQTFAPPPASVELAGAGCAVAGSSAAAPRGGGVSGRPCSGWGPSRSPTRVAPAYHAAASMASNFLVTLEAAAERVAGGAGLEPHEARTLLLPLVRRTVENWGALGPEGP